MHFKRSGLAALMISGLLVACGGGGGGSVSVGTGDPGTSSSAPSSSSSSSSSASSQAVILDQTGNPIYGELETYKSWLSKNSNSATALDTDKTKADNIVSWQMPHGGFYKEPSWYSNPWKTGTTRSGWYGEGDVELGTIDNDATISEILFLADVYKRGGNAAHRDSARKAMDFLLKMQYASGGWPQVYPARTYTLYSNDVTFNDDAMARVLALLDHAQKQRAPLDGDFFTDEQRAKLASAIEKGVDFILKAQIVQNGVKTVWCAQHDPVNFKPTGARAYELPSKSGKESVLVTAFLMSRPQTDEVKAAVQGALAWFRNPATQLANITYSRDEARAGRNPFVTKAGSTTWYRFYDLDQDRGFFSDRTAGKFYDIMQIEKERLSGYEWGGSYGTTLLNYASKVGY